MAMSKLIHMKKPFYIFVLMVLLVQTLNAQNPQWKVFAGYPGGGVIGRIAIEYDSAFNNNIVWFSTNKGLVKLDGESWIVYDSATIGFHLIPSTIAIDRNNNKWLGSNKGAYMFDGVNWINYNSNNSGIGSNLISEITIDNNNVKWFATFGLVRFDDISWKIYRTTNSGIHFNSVRNVYVESYERWIGSNTSGISLLIETPTDTSWRAFTSSNSGLSVDDVRKITKDSSRIVWIGTSMGGLNTYKEKTNQWGLFVPPGTASSIVIDKQNNKWIGSGGTGMYKLSHDSVLTNFRPENSPMPSYSVNSIAIDSNQNIWIATGSGLVVYNENGIVGIEDPGIIELPKQFKLYQNYPNPFNPTTKIKYDILKPGNIKLSVYDVSGKEVKILFNTFVQLGDYEIEFNAFDLTSGVYFYSLEMNEFKETRKMIYLK